MTEEADKRKEAISSNMMKATIIMRETEMTEGVEIDVANFAWWSYTCWWSDVFNDIFNSLISLSWAWSACFTVIIMNRNQAFISFNYFREILDGWFYDIWAVMLKKGCEGELIILFSQT